jgi:hypothetical protein
MEEITPAHRLPASGHDDEKKMENEYDVKDSYGDVGVFSAGEEAVVKK